MGWSDALLIVRTHCASTLCVHVICFLPWVVIIRMFCFVFVGLNTCIRVCSIEHYGKGTSTCHECLPLICQPFYIIVLKIEGGWATIQIPVITVLDVLAKVCAFL